MLHHELCNQNCIFHDAVHRDGRSPAFPAITEVLLYYSKMYFKFQVFLYYFYY